MVGKDEIKCLIRSLEALPTLPSVAVALMKIALDHSHFKEELLRCIEIDPSITTRILKVANEAIYGREGKVTTLREAVEAIGVRQLRTIVLSSSVMDVFQDRMAPYGSTVRNLWLHSLSTAVHAALFVPHSSSIDPQEAFVAGLIHDIGKLLLCVCLEDEYPKILTRARANNIALHHAELETLGFDHSEVGALVLEQWNLPEILRDVVCNHHRPVEMAFAQERHFVLACVVAVANRYSYEHAIGSGGDPEKASFPATLFERVPLLKERVEQNAKEAPFAVNKLTRLVELSPLPLSTYYSYLKHANRELGHINQDREQQHYVLVQKERELRGINQVGLALLACTTTESAVKVIAEGLVTSFSFSHTLCIVYHNDHWIYRAEAIREGTEWVCHSCLKKRSRVDEEALAPHTEASPWLHVDLIGKEGPLGYLKVYPGAQCKVPISRLGLVLASYAKLASESLERIKAYQRIQGLSQDLMRAIARIDKEKALVELQKKQKETILAGLPIGLALVTTQRTVELCNPEFQRVLSIQSPIQGYVDLCQLFPDPELPKSMAAAFSGATEPPREYSVPGPDPFWMKILRWFLVPIRTDAAPVSHVLFVVQDITEEKELQRRTAEAERMASIGELAAATSHNLRSPLGAAKGILELFLDEIDTGALRIVRGTDDQHDVTAPYRDQLHTAIRGLTRCFSVIEDLIDYSRMRVPHAEVLRLTELLEGTDALIGELLRDRGIRVEKDIQFDTVFGRKADLIQVFLSLYSNAYKAMPQGGVLTVTSRPYRQRSKKDRSHVEILVSDTGHGMAPDVLSRIFDPTFTTAQGPEGTGIGLTLAKRIVEDHRGTIEVESVVGRGTTVVLRLPAAPEGVS